MLTWNTENASNITIEGLGELPASGTKSVTPNDSMTYTLVAKGPGGTQNASARVTVNEKTAEVAPPSPSEEELFARNVKDVLFDYDKAEIRNDQASTAQQDAAFLMQHPSIKVVLPPKSKFQHINSHLFLTENGAYPLTTNIIHRIARRKVPTAIF